MRKGIDVGRMTSERQILRAFLRGETEFNTSVPVLRKPCIRNTVGEEELGLYRPRKAKKFVTADAELMDEFAKSRKRIPSFKEAGPHKKLGISPQTARAAIVCSGGLAPGLHSVIHAIVKRHCATYEINTSMKGGVFGVYDSFRGLCSLADNLVPLTPDDTEKWLGLGGCELGCIRYFPGEEGEPSNEATANMVAKIAENLEHLHINILYVLGGDGSMAVAHKIAQKTRSCSVIGVPKTMDNDILWVWESFGFNTAVMEATRVINTMHREAEATRRICLIELFGAESGFVAANASLASGQVDLVLIPEVFKGLTNSEAQMYWKLVQGHLLESVEGRVNCPHGLVVVAEGVATVLADRGFTLDGQPVERGMFTDLLAGSLLKQAQDARGRSVEIFINRPRHYIRAAPANPHDQIYCERLGALAVDNALAGYTDCMISQWLTEYVLVPLRLVADAQKSIPIEGIFWKQVINSTGQPSFHEALE